MFDKRTSMKKNFNLIILEKDGLNNDNNKRKRLNTGNILTLKGENFYLKMSLTNGSDINKGEIVKTLTNIKNQLIESENGSKIDNRNIVKKIKTDNDGISINKVNILDKKDIKKLGDIDHLIYYNTKNDLKLSLNSKFKNNQSIKTIQMSDKAIISITNSDIDKYTEIENRKKSKIKDIAKFNVKSSVNEVEEIFENNDISVYEYMNYNNTNHKVKFSTNSDNNYNITNNNFKNTKVNIANKFESNDLTMLDDSENIKNIKFKNNYANYQNSLNDYIKKRDIYFKNNNSIKSNNNNKEKEIYDSISENKKLVIIRNSRLKKNSINKYETTKFENRMTNSKIFNSKNMLIENENRILKPIIELKKKITCFLCEKVFNIEKIFFPNCKIHALCKKCIKNYYEDKFENNNFSLKCPDANCNEKIEFDIIKNIINILHYELFLENQKEEYNKNYLGEELCINKSKSKVEHLKPYFQKHFLDINSNKNFYLYNENKDIYCNKCLKPTLFTKINGYFIKCLNCHQKICKYCLKEFNDIHMDIMNENHCKVYYRRGKFLSNKKINFITEFCLQLLFVITMYYLTVVCVYFITIQFLKRKLKFENNKTQKSFIRLISYIFIQIFSIALFLVCFPFVLIIFPFFPALILLTDY